MNVSFLYFAQVRAAAGAESESIAVSDDTPLRGAVEAVVAKHGDDFRNLVFGKTGEIQASLLVLVNGIPADRSGDAVLKEGDQVSLLSAVAGG